jgi:hypothetical protein
MASAVFHTHFTARTFHVDIKPANVLLDMNRDLILIDCEQSGAAPYTLAPEADGSWDVEERRAGSSSCDGADSTAPRLDYRTSSRAPPLGSTKVECLSNLERSLLKGLRNGRGVQSWSSHVDVIAASGTKRC